MKRRRRNSGDLEFVNPPAGMDPSEAYMMRWNDMNGQPVHQFRQTPEASFAAKREVGEHLQAFRVSQGLNRREFGEVIGYEAAEIAYIENGHDFPSEHFIGRVCNRFGITESELLYGRRHTLSTQEAVQMTLEEQAKQFRQPILDAFSNGMTDQHELNGEFAPLWSKELQYFEDAVDNLEGFRMTREQCERIKDEAFNYSTANASAMYRCGVRDALQLILEALTYRAPVMSESRV